MSRIVHPTALRARTRSYPISTVIRTFATRKHTVESDTRKDVDLIGPSDPISNLRPVIYASSSSSSSSSTSSSNISTAQNVTPYSIEEFTISDRSTAKNKGIELTDRLRKEGVDRKNHDFWARSNLLFETHLESRLLPLGPTPSSAAELAEYNLRKEAIVTQFYRDWSDANREKQAEWVWGWWSDVREDVGRGLRKMFGGR